MGSNLMEIPEYYRTLVNTVATNVPNEDVMRKLVERISSFDTDIVGAGRTGADGRILTYLLNEAGAKAHFVSDAAYLLRNGHEKTIIALSGSGNSDYTILSTGALAAPLPIATELKANALPFGNKNSPIFSITTNANLAESKVANLSKYSGGEVINISARNKDIVTQVEGVNSPVMKLGTEFELKLLLAVWDIVGMYLTGKSAKDCQKELVGYLNSYTPSSKDVESANLLLPETSPKYKIKTISNDGIDEAVIDFFGLRLRHCAKPGKERRVESFKSSTPTKKGDLNLVISGVDGEDKERVDVAAILANTEKKKGGANVLGICYENSALLDVIDTDAGDYAIKIPRITVDNNESEAYGRALKDMVYAARTIFTAEAMIYWLTEKEYITNQDTKANHSWIF